MAWLTGCGVDASVHDASLRDLQRYQAEAASLQARLERSKSRAKEHLDACDLQRTGAESRLEVLQGEVKALRQDRGDLEGNLVDMESRVAALQKAQQRRQRRSRRLLSMEERFSDLAQDHESVSVHRGASQVVVRIAGGALFDSGRAAVKDDAKRVVSDVAEVLRGVPDASFVVEGHTDDRPLGEGSVFADNRGLAAQRSLAIVRALVERGVAAKRLTLAAHGATRPLASNDDGRGRTLNRRVQLVWFLPHDDPDPSP